MWSLAWPAGLLWPWLHTLLSILSTTRDLGSRSQKNRKQFFQGNMKHAHVLQHELALLTPENKKKGHFGGYLRSPQGRLGLPMAVSRWSPLEPKSSPREPNVPASGNSPKSSERLVRHARARIPNDVRVREGDYFVGSRAPQTQGRKGAQGSNETKRNEMIFWERAGRNRLISQRFDFGCITWDRRAPFAITCVRNSLKV